MKKLILTGTAIILLGGSTAAFAQADYSVKSTDTMLNQSRYMNDAELPRQAGSEIRVERRADAEPPVSILGIEPAAGGVNTSDFSGLYFGGDLGFAMSNADVSGTGAADGDVGMDGFLGGVFAGYGYAGDPGNLVGYVGLEAGYEWNDADGRIGANSFEKNGSWLVSLKPGMVIGQDALGYGIIGYSLAEFEGAGTDEKFNGLVFGAGTEFNTRTALKMRLEYTYTNFEDENLGTVGFDGHESALKAGTVFRF